MGVEHYILKPRTKEMYYLGKGSWHFLGGIPNYRADFTAYDYWEDVACDIIKAGCYSCEDTMLFISSLAEDIFDFCECEEVRLANDCEMNANEWLDTYTEVKSIENICREVYGE